MFRSLLFIFFILISTTIFAADKNKFVILICSYNNSSWVKQNIYSALNQNHENFRIIYVNDASKDDTLIQLEKALANHTKKDLVRIINNSANQGAMANIYYTIHNYVQDDEIVCLLDGDDFLANDNILSFLDQVYQTKKNKCWMTYGQYKGYPNGNVGQCKNYSRRKSFRDQPFLCSHLRTFYAWLFKKIAKEDLEYEGAFLNVAWDVAMMLPMIEMASNHYVCIPKILYLYNENNPISDFRIKLERQQFLANFIMSKNPYNSLD